MKILLRYAIIGMTLFAVRPLAAATWYVKADGTGDAPTIQAAILSAAGGDVIVLAAGTYTGPGNFNIDFGGKSIMLRSQDGATATIIDCQGNGRGFRLISGEDASTILCGVTIKNGTAGGGKGGAIELKNASANIHNNIIIGCSANGGGGAISITSGSPIIQRNLIDGNTTIKAGGGILCTNSMALIIYNTICANSASAGGGGICVKKNAATIQNNTIAGNQTSGAGAGVLIEQSATPAITHNIIVFNTGGEGLSCSGAAARPFVSCNDLFGNSSGDAICGDDRGNASLDPQFCGAQGSNNYYLQGDSPCTGGLSMCGQLIGALPSLCATTAIERRSWGAIKAVYE